MGISWEDHGKIMGISWEDHGNIMEWDIYFKKNGIQPLEWDNLQYIKWDISIQWNIILVNSQFYRWPFFE